MDINAIIAQLNANVPETAIMAQGATAQEIAAARQQMTQPAPETSQTPVYRHYGNGDKARFGRSRNVRNGKQFKLVRTKEDSYNGNSFTRWVFQRPDGSEWTPSESSISWWAMEYYPDFIGKPEEFFNHLASLGNLTVSTTKIVENDFGNKVQCVKF